MQLFLQFSFTFIFESSQDQEIAIRRIVPALPAVNAQRHDACPLQEQEEWGRLGRRYL